MTGPINDLSNGYLVRDDFTKLDRFNDLFEIAAEVEPRISIAPRKPDYDEGFVVDLDLAGRGAVDRVVRLAATPRGREKLFAAFLGTSPDGWSREAELKMLQVLSPFLDPADIGHACQDDVLGLPEFLPALPWSPEESGGTFSRLQEGCACAVDLEGHRVFVSTDLGFRDLLQVAPRAMAQVLVFRLDQAELDIDADAALRRVCEVLQCDPGQLLADNAMTKTSVFHEGAWVPSYRTAGPEYVDELGG